MDNTAGESKKKSSKAERVILIKHRGHRLIDARVYKDEHDLYGLHRMALATTLSGDALMELVICLLQNMRAEIQLKKAT